MARRIEARKVYEILVGKHRNIHLGDKM